MCSNLRDEINDTGLCIAVFGVESTRDNFHLFKGIRADTQTQTSADRIVDWDTINKVSDLR